VDLQAVQVLGQPHLEPQDLQREVGLLQQLLPVPGVPGLNRGLEQAVQIPLDQIRSPSTNRWFRGN
jgi:hypothetical protein